ncbi:ankyrin repeats (3 copies) domain-containing protein [Rhizoctonia solani AG-1 IA]|uniref:Ankyrin repeats (3 copies) domain-containing protein n=1 Tax=Thanatephorus cucumeris (strain AG1-IA) TaxID=983506 RepID=L8WR97_THACA|nr:ankyrin repeats (3 copies) domain-containing protein [Rhizoctonia solani AG-1 IA]
MTMRRRSSSPNTPSSESSPSSSDLPLAVPPIESIDVNGAGKEYDEARLFRAFINDNAFDSSVTTVVQPASIGFDGLHSVLSSAQRYHVPPATHVVKPSALIPPAAPVLPQTADEETMEDQPEPETETKPNPDVQVVHPPKENCNNLPVRVRNVPLQGAKSRVETQLKVTIDLVWDPTPRTHFHQASSSSSGYSADTKEELAPTVGSWEWLSLPPGSATKRRGRKEAKIAPTPAQTLTLHTMVHVASAPHTAARACKKCLAREAKRAERKRKSRYPNDPPPSELPDLSSLGCEDDKIVLYNCADVLDFKSGTVDLPVRLTCYCRHHSEKLGFCITFILRDHTGRTVGTGVTPPIMITDDHKSTARKVQAQQSAVPGGAGLVPPTPATAISTGSSLVAAIGASTMNGSRKGSKDKGGAKHRMKPYDRSRASSVGLTGVVKEEAGVLPGASNYATPSTQGYTSPPPQSPTLFTTGAFGMQSALLGDVHGMTMLSPTRSAFLSPPRSPVHSRGHTRPHSPVQMLSHPPSSNHAPSPSHTNMHSPSHTALHSPIHTSAHSRAHSPSRGILSGGMQSDFMDSLLGSTGGLLDMNGDPLLGMDSDTLMANTFAGTDTQMFDPTTTDPTNPDWEAMLQELTNQSPTSGLKPPTPQGAIYVEHPPWGVPATWPPESIDLAPPETTPIPRVSRVVPNSGPIQGGIEVTLLGENFSRAYECKFGDYVATETALWGGNTLVCLLPPAAQAGAVAVRIKGYENVPLRPGEREVMFTYKDDMVDRNLMELALRVVGQRMTGRQEEPCNIARRIVAVGEMQNNSNMVVTRLAQSIIESDVTPQDNENGSTQQQQEQGRAPTRQEELIQFLKLLDVPNVGSRGVSTSSAVSLQNETGHTLLHLCSVLGFDALATDLISRGADLDVRDATGQTPLHLAALRGEAACVRVLLQAGADTEIVNAYGMAPIDIAREHARSEVMALLEGADDESDEVEEEDEEGSELRAPSLDESTGADADESDLGADDERRSRVPAEVSSEEDSASDDLFAADASRPSLDSVIDGRPAFLGETAKFPSTWFHRTFSHLQPQKAWPLPQINLPDMPALRAWPVTIPWPQTPEGGSFDLGSIRGFLGSKPQQPNAANLTVYPPAPQADGQQGPNQVQLRARLARRLGYYPTEVTDREIRAYTLVVYVLKLTHIAEDRMLVLFWLPILLIVIAWGLYQSIPVAFKAMANTIRGYLPLASR